MGFKHFALHTRKLVTLLSVTEVKVCIDHRGKVRSQEKNLSYSVTCLYKICNNLCSVGNLNKCSKA